MRLVEGDNRASLERMIAAGELVDSVVTDPPYGLVSVTKRFGGQNAAPAKHGTDGAYARASAGFMGSKWDGTGIERDPEFWRLVFDVMKPGAYIAAFSSSRTYGYMQIALEEAGFITHPMIGWTFASGFPKAHSASKAIDKVLGTTDARETLAELYTAKRIKPGATVVAEGGYGKQDIDFTATLSAGGSPEARRWDGWSYGGQAQKPAMEPIYIGQKPFSEKNGALNILRHGVGAINIDGCRVSYENDGPNPATNPLYRAQNGYANDSAADHGSSSYSLKDGTGQRNPNELGRWPANLIHDGSAAVTALFPDSKGQLAAASTSQDTRRNQNVYGDMARGSTGQQPRADSGSAARFFNSFGYSDVEEIQRVTGMTWGEATDFHEYLLQHEAPDSPPLLHYAKANKRDRAGSKHATVKPVGLIEHLQRMYTPPGGVTLDPFAGSGTSGQAALNNGLRCILMEAEAEYVADIKRRFDLPTGDDGFEQLLTDDFDALLI